MKFYLFLIGLLISIAGFSQNKTDLIGTWKVNQVLLPEEVKNNKHADIPRIEKIFSQSKFYFNSDGSCKMDMPEKELQFTNGKWTFNEKERAISINGENHGEKGLQYKLFVSLKNGHWQFAVDESPIILEVQKITAAPKL